MPVGQIVAAVAAVFGQYDPAGQLIQTDWRPTSGEYVPEGHNTAVVNPVVLQYVPAGHGVGVEVFEFGQ